MKVQMLKKMKKKTKRKEENKWNENKNELRENGHNLIRISKYI
jgi:hypothetical protein